MVFNYLQGQTAVRGDMMLPKSSEVRFVAILEEAAQCQLYSAVFHEDKAFPLFKISDLPVSTAQYVHYMHLFARIFSFHPFLPLFLKFSRLA